MTDLLPGQLVDVKLAYVEDEVIDTEASTFFDVLKIERRLQYKKLIKTDSGELTWTGWADVPVVEEG